MSAQSSTSTDVDLLRPGRDFDAVVVGASAGALEALQALMPHLRCHSTAFIIVLHQSAESAEPEFVRLRALCHLPLRLAVDGEPVKPGIVYLAPPGRHLLVGQDEVFELDDGPLVHYARPSVDVLFESAANTWGRRAVGVILSGANEDGAHGLREIGLAGGLTLVQNPDSALVPYMPTVAIRAAHPAAVLSLDAMAKLFEAWADAEAAAAQADLAIGPRNGAA
jgi:two-component system, chemotaxis family, protein-glutamate methylesterase/glutaminase